MKPKIVDLFAGVGGLSLGFEMAGFEVALANECDESIAESYIKNRKKSNMIIADITKLSIPETFGHLKNKIAIVVGGPPCQGFSQKGQRKTINDERNFLFKYYYNVVSFLKPQYFLMENVPNLLTAENGFFKSEIEAMFSKLGYLLDSGVLNASDFGVPQNRRRAFIVGKRSDDVALTLQCPRSARTAIWDAISDLDFLNSGEGEECQKYRLPAQSDYQIKMRAGSDMLYNHVATKHSKIALQRLEMIPPNCGKEVLPKEHITKSIYSGTWSRMRKDDVSVTITTRFDTPSSGEFSHPYLNRAITVREAARIQSFPDSFIFYGTKCSQMKQVGNAVPPILAKALADNIMLDIMCETKTTKIKGLGVPTNTVAANM